MTIREINKRIDSIIYAINSIDYNTQFAIVDALEAELNQLLNMLQEIESRPVPKNLVKVDFKTKIWTKEI